MKSNLTEKLLSICGNSMDGFSINNSTEEQRTQVEFKENEKNSAKYGE